MGAPSPEGLLVYATLPGVSVGSYRFVHVVAYHETPTLTAIRISDRYHRVLRQRFPKRTALLSWVAPALSVPSQEVRKFGADMFRAVAPEIQCSATVITGGGFWASTARSVLAGIQLLSRSACPNRTFGEVDEACNWMTSTFDTTDFDPAELAMAMQHLTEP
jgi:hypothetical protein